MPQYFSKFGYHTVNLGKIFHNLNMQIADKLSFRLKDDDSCSTQSSGSSKGSFNSELAKISLLKDLRERNPVKEIKPIPLEKTLFSKMRARSGSPTRESLTMLDRNHPLFVCYNPVATGNFTGLEPMEITEYEEDEDLKQIKEQYCQMLDEIPSEGSDRNPLPEFKRRVK